MHNEWCWQMLKELSTWSIHNVQSYILIIKIFRLLSKYSRNIFFLCIHLYSYIYIRIYIYIRNSKPRLTLWHLCKLRTTSENCWHSQTSFIFRKSMPKPSRRLVDSWRAYLAIKSGSHELFNGALLFSSPSDLTDVTKIAYSRR